MAKNTLKSISVSTERESDGRLDWLTVRFWRKDRSRYYSTRTITDASFKRLRRILYSRGNLCFGRSFMSVDWFNIGSGVWQDE